MDGYIMDRGFQVLLTAYPEAQRYLDYEILDLQYFDPGAIVYDGTSTLRISDPLREPSSMLTMMFSSIGSLADKLKMFSYTQGLKRLTIEQLFQKKEITTLAHLQNLGFSSRIIELFFRPFFAGIFLESNLETSSRMFEFVFKMFSEGNAAIPAKGMQEIPNQLVSNLHNTTIKYDLTVRSVENNKIILDDNDTIHADHIIIAGDPTPMIAGLKQDVLEYHDVYNLYFETDRSFINRRAIALRPTANGIINNMNFMTDVSSQYSTNGKALLSVSIVNPKSYNASQLPKVVADELSVLAASEQIYFRHLKTYHVRKALPKLNDLQYTMEPTACRLTDSVYLAGDHMLNASLNAAMTSGRIAAHAILQQS